MHLYVLMLYVVNELRFAGALSLMAPTQNCTQIRYSKTE
jgi:hypothetical protein